jgi:hypothetical protein
MLGTMLSLCRDACMGGSKTGQDRQTDNMTERERVIRVPLLLAILERRAAGDPRSRARTHP